MSENQDAFNRLGSELAYVMVALQDYERNVSSEYHARVLASFVNHLPEHIAEEFIADDGHFVSAPSPGADPKAHTQRVGDVSKLMWQVIRGGEDSDLNGNSAQKWFKKTSNSSKHALTRRSDAGNDSRNFTAHPDWESGHFWEEFDQVIVRDEVNNRIEFDELFDIVEDGLEKLISKLGFDVGGVRALMGPVTGNY